MKDMPDFKSGDDRSQWIIDNADHFTVVNYKGRGQSIIQKASTLIDAEAAAQCILTTDPRARIMIYAVSDIFDTFVKSVRR